MTETVGMGHVNTVEVYKGKDGDWWWRRVASNGNKVASSGEGYSHRQHAIHMAEKLNPGCVYKVEPAER